MPHTHTHTRARACDCRKHLKRMLKFLLASHLLARLIPVGTTRSCLHGSRRCWTTTAASPSRTQESPASSVRDGAFLSTCLRAAIAFALPPIPSLPVQAVVPVRPLVSALRTFATCMHSNLSSVRSVPRLLLRVCVVAHPPNTCHVSLAVIATFEHWEFHSTLAVGSRVMATVARTFPAWNKLFMTGHKLSVVEGCWGVS